MSHILTEDDLGSVANAQFLALAADYSYSPQSVASKKFADDLGLDAQLYEVDNTQAYVATNADHIVVAFRGTESPTSIDGLKDWFLTDALNLLIVPEGRLGTDLMAAGVGARFHQGFVHAIGEIWDPVFAGIEAEWKKSERPIWITGHSLGGALAHLSAWLLQRKMINVHQVYTFGSPMIGNEAAMRAFNKELKGKIFRYVNDPDPVPKLPTLSLIANEFAHCDREMALAVTATTASSAAEMFRQFAAKTIQGVLNLNLMNELWAEILARVQAHEMNAYRKLIV
ncbi:MAG: lipase family protein [Pirellulales bacterium]|nr:lipase family protein [Pirellulales bacterium]